MNMTEMTLVSIMTSAALATTMMNASNQVDKINAQQEQVKCIQRSFESLNSINPNDNSMYEYVRNLNTEQSIEKKCNLDEQQ